MATWPIPEPLRDEIRRVLGFPDLLAQASLQAGYPTFASELQIFQPYAILEQKFAVLATATTEAIAIFGQLHPYYGTAYIPASFALTLTAPTGTIASEATVTVNVGGTSVSTTGGASALAAAQALATAANANGSISALAIAQASAVDPGDALLMFYSVAPGTLGNGTAVMAVTSDPSLIVSTSGPTVSGTLAGGQNPPGPFIPGLNGGPTVFGYLPIIQALESDLGGGRQFLAFEKADVVTFRLSELDQRMRLLQRFRRELADRFSVPVDPDIAGNRRRMTQRKI